MYYLLIKYEQNEGDYIKKHTFSILFLIFFILTLNGCVFSTTGESLNAFSNRMNEINESYNMTAEGYIIDTENCELTKFFRFSEYEIMLNFRYDKKYRLNEMNIVFDCSISEKCPEAMDFIKACIKCFIQNENTEVEILNTTDFEKAISKINKKTISAEVDNIKTEIDTTELGTVITIHKKL